MKYVRTKDGNIYQNPTFSKSISEKTLQPIIIGKDGYEEVLKQADTIEELCDEFVITSKDNNHIWKMFKQKGKFLDIKYQQK